MPNETPYNIILNRAIPEPSRWKYLFHSFSQVQCWCSSSINTYLTFTCIWHCDLPQEDNESNIAPHLRSLARWSRHRKQKIGALGPHSKWQILAVKGWPWCLWRLQIRCSLHGFDLMPILVGTNTSCRVSPGVSRAILLSCSCPKNNQHEVCQNMGCVLILAYQLMMGGKGGGLEDLSLDAFNYRCDEWSKIL